MRLSKEIKTFMMTSSPVPKDDRLLDDFNCGLNRELLYQGKLYITETHLCFNSNVLGWIAKVLIAFEDVTFMEKTSAAGIVPQQQYPSKQRWAKLSLMVLYPEMLHLD